MPPARPCTLKSQTTSHRSESLTRKEKPLKSFDLRGFSVKSLAVTYSGMPEGHTTIGAERFHFRVRNGIGWFPLAVATRQAFSAMRAVLAHGPLAAIRFSFLLQRIFAFTSNVNLFI